MEPRNIKTIIEKEKAATTKKPIFVENITSKWGPILAKHGYTTIEEAVESDGPWIKGLYRDKKLLGRVAFWKEKGEDGIVIEHRKFSFNPKGKIMVFDDAYGIGNALSYLVSKGIEVFDELSILSYGVNLAPKEPNLFDPSDFGIGNVKKFYTGTIQINNKIYSAENINIYELEKLAKD
ncbi:MAG: hypothetical protein ABIB43_05665 [archaeon]